MARTDNLKNYLTDVANAIREKTNTTDKIKASEFDDKIKGISGASEQWEWTLNNVIDFGSANPTFFKGRTYLKVLPNYLEDKCLEITNWSNAFNGCTNLTEIDINTSNGTNFERTFYNCKGIVDGEVFATNVDFSKATTLFECFLGCSSMTKSPKIDTQATNMRGVFYNCPKLAIVSEIDTSNATNLIDIFGLDAQLTIVPQLNTSKVTALEGVFRGCSSLENFPTLDCSSVTSLTNLFQNCSKLTNSQIKLVNMNTAKTINAPSMFQNCIALTSLDKTMVDASHFYNLTSFVEGCTALESVDLDFSSVNNYLATFRGCTNLKSIKTLDFTNVVNNTYLNNMFVNCTALEDVEIVAESIKVNISFINSSLLTDTSIQNIIDGLATVSTQRTLTLHADVKAKLTDEQKNTITTKNWKLA